MRHAIHYLTLCPNSEIHPLARWLYVAHQAVDLYRATEYLLDIAALLYGGGMPEAKR